MLNDINVVELFAGVGGFHLGLSQASDKYKIIWANQWEPQKKLQHAFNCYTSHFGNICECINEDIANVKMNVPKHDLLVGGFPCQDYSIARTGAEGINGKKGVLWWEIYDILLLRQSKYILLENVDRLLKSPSSQRGRDFGIILRCLDDLGYYVEWRVINAADYGYPQKRRRTLIFACQKKTRLYEYCIKYNHENLLFENGLLAETFKSDSNENEIMLPLLNKISKEIYPTLHDLSKNFKYDFENAGVMYAGSFYTQKVTPMKMTAQTLNDIIEKNDIDRKYFLNDNLEKWKYLKGAKKELRYKPNGEEYFYTEGAIPFPDSLNSPSRTLLTSEGSVNRSTHVIEDYKTKSYRILTPIECERLNGFPDRWTDTGMPEKFRYFTMGNALVVGLIQQIGENLINFLDY